MHCRAVVFALCLVALTPRLSRAADGDPDPSFGGTGAVTAPFTNVESGGGVGLRPDGKIVVAAIDANGLELARYDTNGVLDPAFGTGGIATSVAPGYAVKDLVLQPDGKILLLLAANVNLAIARYDESGVLDGAFGSGGFVAADCGTEFGFLADLLLLSDDRIVVAIAGQEPPAVNHSCVLRFASDGTPDADFGPGGVVALPDFWAGALAEQGSKVVVGGAVTTGGGGPGVMRIQSDGTVDPAFGHGGVVQPTASGFIVDLDVRPNDTILALDSLTRVARLQSNGKLDTAFGAGGVGSNPAVDTNAITPTALAVQRDGRILIGASFYDYMTPLANLHSFYLVRYDVDGAPDATFGTNGALSGGVAGIVAGMVLQPDGKAVLAGDKPASIFDMTARFNVARYLGFTLPCPASPAVGCRGGVVPRAGKLRLDDPTTDGKAKLQWSWQKGAATTLADFGDPVGGDDYLLCLYDESGAATLTTGAVVPGGGTCKGKPCWKPLGTTGFAYTDSRRTRFGISAIKLKAGIAGKAQVAIKGAGASLPASPFPVPVPLRVQMIAANGQCWESVFSSAGVTRNDAMRFQGKSD